MNDHLGQTGDSGESGRSIIGATGEYGSKCYFRDDGVAQFTIQDPKKPWIYHIHADFLQGRPAIIGLAIMPSNDIDPSDRKPISGRALRSVPIEDITRRITAAMSQKWERRVQEFLAQMRIPGKIPGVRSRSSDHYLQVAWFYRYGEAIGKAPRKVIAQKWGVGEATASRWAKKARDLGFLDPYVANRPKAQPKSTPSGSFDEAELFHKLNIEIDGRVGPQYFALYLTRLMEDAASNQVREAAQALAKAIWQETGIDIDMQ